MMERIYRSPCTDATQASLVHRRLRISPHRCRRLLSSCCRYHPPKPDFRELFFSKMCQLWYAYFDAVVFSCLPLPSERDNLPIGPNRRHPHFQKAGL
jgi:hypothetical protein